MKFAPLILKHLRKNWLRTLSTVLAMAVCIFLICTLQTVVDAVNYGLHLGNASRLVTRHYVSLVFNLPNSYKNKIAAIPGVQNTTIVSWFGGDISRRLQVLFPQPRSRAGTIPANLSRDHAAGRPEAGVVSRWTRVHRRPKDR